MTERLYYTDSYLTNFDAAIVDRSPDGLRVYLDRTAFYPTSGGQSHDTGWIDGAAVTDVVDEGERLAHVLAVPVAGAQVSARIDWPRRFDHMQQHTGQHLLSAVLADLYRCATTSVHFGAESSSLDLAIEALAHEQIIAAERVANEVVTENRPVEVSFEEAERAAGLRKASAREGALRIVTIRDLDRSACGGTHVRATGEIGPILIRKLERVRKSVRLEFLCGARAVRQFRGDLDLLNRLTAGFSTTAHELPGLIEGQRAELKDATAARRELETTLAGFQARELYQSTPAGSDGIRVILVREDRGPVDRLRPLAQAVAALPHAIFVGAVLAPPAALLAASEDSGVDAGRTLRAALEAVGGRGGGNARLAQGSLKDPGGLEPVVRSLVNLSS